MAVLLGIDLGYKRIGLALSDIEETFAVPLDIHQYRDKNEFIEHLRGLISSRNIQKLVFGLPLNADGTEGKKAKETIKYVEDISLYIAKPMILWDERYTTQEATARLETFTKRKKIKKYLDAVAAQLILQSYIDNHIYLDVPGIRVINAH